MTYMDADCDGGGGIEQGMADYLSTRAKNFRPVAALTPEQQVSQERVRLMLSGR
jgi:hypothetical protein